MTPKSESLRLSFPVKTGLAALLIFDLVFLTALISGTRFVTVFSSFCLAPFLFPYFYLQPEEAGWFVLSKFGALPAMAFLALSFVLFGIGLGAGRLTRGSPRRAVKAGLLVICFAAVYGAAAEAFSRQIAIYEQNYERYRAERLDREREAALESWCTLGPGRRKICRGRDFKDCETWEFRGAAMSVEHCGELYVVRESADLPDRAIWYLSYPGGSFEAECRAESAPDGCRSFEGCSGNLCLQYR
jgi:hypothetical protein